MKKIIYSAFLLFIAGADLFAQNKNDLKNFNDAAKKTHIAFSENKGQIMDQDHKARPDVLYSGSADGMVYHLGNKGISYQLYKSRELADQKNVLPADLRKDKEAPGKIKEISIYRLDVNWLNTNKKVKTLTDRLLPGALNYYTEACPAGALNVRSYTGVTYRNIYNDIDLHFYGRDNDLEYDYLVAPYADYRQIRLEVKGADKIFLQDGAVIMETPFGTIRQNAPLVFQNEKQLDAGWVLEENVLSFKIEGHDPALPMVIDPVIRAWGTYYGDGGDVAHGCTTDANGNVYICGITNSYSTIATSGAHQSLPSNQGQDAFVVKFNSAGQRQWGTFYGGAGYDLGSSCSVDANGNVYLCGVTSTTNNSANNGVISSTTAPVHQVNYAGNFDAFLVKFNSSGVRQWGTYYGGSGSEYGYSCAVDPAGNVYACGYSSTTVGGTVIASGGHQSSNAGFWDAFLVKFNTNGQRLWGTYYGDQGTDLGYSCAVDASGDVYMCGQTQPYSNSMPLATSGAHQGTWANGWDSFLVKFSSSGARQWGTYYGDTGDDVAYSCATDGSGNVFMSGYSSFSTGTIVATTGSHQMFAGGQRDAFLVKFNTSGQRQWGTYYGTAFDDYGRSCATDVSGNVYMAGDAPGDNASAIATYGNHQYLAGGQIDAFLVKFNTAGQRQWGTYYGGFGYDVGNGCAVGAAGEIYVAGSTSTYSGQAIATPGSHQPSYGLSSTSDAFLVSFFECTNIPATPVVVGPSPTFTLCFGGTATFSVSSPGNISWYASPVSTTVIATGSVFTTPVLQPGTFVYFAESTNTCSPSSSRAALNVIVYPPPVIAVNSGSVCAGSSFTISPTGAASYTYLPNGPVVNSPAATVIYTVYGTSQAGCTNSTGVSGVISVQALPQFSISSGSKMICEGESAAITVTGANEYLWNTSDTARTLIINPVTTTGYTVTGTAPSGCTNIAAYTQSVSPCTGLQKTAGDDMFLLYPNPAQDKLTLVVREPSQVIMTNAIGQTVLKRQTPEGKNVIDVSGYPAGVYFIQVFMSEKLRATEKIIVKDR